MNRKVIVKKLTEKFNEWVESIKDDNVKEIVRKNTIITGGCIASMFLGEEANDFDFYFRTQDAAYSVAKYYIDILNKDLGRKIRVRKQIKDIGESVNIFVRSQGILKAEKKENEEYYPIFVSKNAISLSDKVQCIIRFTGEPQKICEDFDFVHITNYWCSWNENLVVAPKAIESILNKELFYQGSKYSVTSLFRVKKFLERGWFISTGQLLKICYDISELDLHTFDVLEDQLTGVDVSYFAELIDSLKNCSRDKLNSVYMFKVISEMFDPI